MDEPLTGQDAIDALTLYHRLAARRVRYTAALDRALRVRHCRALLAAKLRGTFSAPLRSVPCQSGRAPRPRPRARLTRSCRVATAPGEPSRPDGTARG